VFSVFERENADAAEKLDRLCEPNNLFELTSRKYMFIVPDCLDECLREARAVIDGLKFTNTRDVMSREFVGMSGAAMKVEEFTVKCVSAMIERIIVGASTRNKTEAGKLRAFIAGDTLAEILLSQAFLTPIVRECAVRTLNNMVNNIPQPPTDQPPAETVRTKRYA
jgi:hypothetical protein